MQTRLGGEICSSDVNMHIIRVMENLWLAAQLVPRSSLKSEAKLAWYFPETLEKIRFCIDLLFC